ncbi:MAG: hypothetical protein K5767_00275 [Clostridia bacterium]|nr:hypothetical protein [Clostridia bacterium]
MQSTLCSDERPAELRGETARAASAGSRGILLHDMKNTLRSNRVLLILGTVIFSLMLPVSLVAIREKSLFNVDFTHDQLKYMFFQPELRPALQAAAVLFGVTAGMCLFSFMNERHRISFYLSLGLKRRKLFAVRAAAGIAVILPAIGLPMLCSLLLNLSSLGPYAGMVPSALVLTLLLTGTAYCSMLLTSMCCCLSGTRGEALVMSSSLLALVPVGAYFVNVMCRTFLWGNVYGMTTYAGKAVEGDLMAKTAAFDPVLFAFDGLEKYGSFTRTMENSTPEPVNPAYPVAAAAALMLLTVAACLIFERRKAENAQIAGISPVHDLIVGLVWPVCAFAFLLDALKNTGHVTAIAGAAVAGGLTWLLIRRASPGAVTSVLSGLRGAAVPAAVVLVSGILIFCDLFGYSSKVPDEAAVEQVSVTFAGDPSQLPEAADSVSCGGAYYSDACITFRSPESIEKVREIHREIIRDGWHEIAVSGEMKNSVLPYDIRITYDLKDGGKVSRYYDRARVSTLAALLETEDSREFRDAAGSVIRGDLSDRLWNSQAFSGGNIYLASGDMRSVRKISAGSEERKELLSAIAADMASKTPEERYHPEDDDIGILLFTLNGDGDAENFRLSNSNAKIYLDRKDRNTLSLLDSWGAGLKDPGEVESITLQKFDPQETVNGVSAPMSLFFSEYAADSDREFLTEQDFGNRPVLEDPELTAQLVPALRSSYYMDGGGYLAAVRYAGSGKYVYKFIPQEEAPDFLREKMK